MTVNDFKFSLLLGLIGGAIGFLVGLALPSGLGVLAEVDYSQASQNPAEFFVNFIILGIVALITEVFSTIIGSLLLGIIGAIMDIIIFVREGAEF